MNNYKKYFVYIFKINILSILYATQRLENGWREVLVDVNENKTEKDSSTGDFRFVISRNETPTIKREPFPFF